MAQITNCLKLISRINDGDQDSLISRIDELQGLGVPAQRAQVQAAIDVLARLQRDAGSIQRSARRNAGRSEEDIAAARADGWRITDNDLPSRESAERIVKLRTKGNGIVGPVDAWQDAEARVVESDSPGLWAIETRKPNIARSSKRNDLGLYSALERGIEGMQTKQAPAGAWKAQIKGLVNKGVVKQDEVTWSGVEDWLDLQGGKVSKEAVAEYLRQGGVQVQEIVLGNQNDRQKLNGEYDRAVAASDAAGGAMNPVYIASLAPEDRKPEEQALLDAWNRVNENLDESWLSEAGSPKYEQYTIPGGDNYREVLITLPSTKLSAEHLFFDIIDEDGSLIEAGIHKDNVADAMRNMPGSRAVPTAEYDSEAAPENAYQSNHWDQPNVLAHIRVNDRVDVDGRKILFVEELQSDWGQDGKKKGFNNASLPPGHEVRKISVRNPLAGLGGNTVQAADRYAVFDSIGNKLTTDFQTEGGALSAFLADSRKVPPAPFVTKTEGWLNLALKRVIAMAVDGGYDAVAFVNGDQSADHYDLSKRVAKVTYNINKNSISAYADDRPGAQSIFTRAASEDELPDIIGKEVADRLINAEPNPNGLKILRGLDLKVGGEGMRAFYDKIVPNAVKALLKRVGGEGLRNIEIVTPRGKPTEYADFTAWQNAPKEQALEQQGFDITESMREKVSTEGLPLFSRKRGWQGFPDSVVDTNLGAQSKDPSYEAAKAGDMKAALELVSRVMSSDVKDKVRRMIGDSKPIVVSVHAEEAAGRNKIPLATAIELGDRLGLEVDTKIVQSTRAKRTGADGMARIGVQPEFTGDVVRGADYLIVDDTLTQGGTIAQLKTHIEEGGGRVVGAFALSGKQYSAKISLDEQTLSQLREQYDSIEPWWRSELGYGFAGLTQSEARFILKSGLSPDQVRDRVAAARQAAGIGAGAQDQAQLSAKRDVTETTEHTARSASRRPEGLEIVEVEDGFDAMIDGKRVGRLRDNLPRGAAEQLDENASVDIVKVDNEFKGKGVGSALYDAFNEKHGGRIAPSGKTSLEAWALWKRKFPEKVDLFVESEAARIRDGADPMMVVRNITDPEVARRVSAAVGDMVIRSARRQTETPEFKRWFGDSKVVDAEGKPLVVYHGTTADFRAFEGGSEYHFASNPDEAARYAPDGETGSHVKPVYVALKRPLIVETDMQPAEAWDTMGGQYREDAEAGWHDGVIIKSGDGDVNVIAFRPEQVKSAIGNNGNFDPNDANITRSIARPAFYSQLQRAIEQVPDRIATMAAPQWKLWLDANASKLGIKKDEIEWSGIGDYLKLRGKDKVTRDELVAYLADSGVRVQDVVLGSTGLRDTGEMYVAEANDWGDEWAVFTEDGSILGGTYESRGAAEQAMDEMNSEGKPTKYGTYTVPGGENYREVLIALPDGRTPAPERAARPRVVDRGHDDRGRAQFEVVQDGEVVDIFSNWAEAQDRALEIEEEENIRRNLEWRKSQPVTYKSSHWDQPNILAHLRVDDRTDADGNKVLFINEIQSDWGQDGKKKGIKSEFKPTTPEVTGKVLTGREFVAERSMPAAAANAWLQGRNDIRRDLGKPPVSLDDTFTVIYEDGIPKIVRDGAADPKAVAATRRKRYDAMIADARRRHELDQASRVPAAPFISDTKTWASLALKRAIMMAVEGGYDRVALITGQQAADLYDLSKQVETVTAYKVDGGYKISARALDGDALPAQSAKNEQELADIIGKELAERIVRDLNADGMGDRAMQVYSGLDLKVGGEGMRAFYDQIIPQVARDVLKKLGGGSIEKVSIGESNDGKFVILKPDGTFHSGIAGVALFPSRASAQAAANKLNRLQGSGHKPAPAPMQGGEQPGFDITPAMREKVASGVPLFSKSRNPQVDTPEFRRWFGDSKVVDAEGKPLVVYHGTSADFTEFDTDSFFTPDAKAAKKYGKKVVAVYLSLKNPKVIDYEGREDNDIVFDIEQAKEDGHDGLIVLDTYDGYVAGDQYIAFHPEQVKSATGNNGQFDPANPDITKSLPRIPGLNAGPVERTTGDYGREYTPQQLRMFKNVGRTTSKPALIDRLKEARKDLGKKMAQGIVDQFRPIRELGGNAYTLARLSKGSAGAFEALLGHGKLKIVDGAYDADTTGGFLDLVGKPLGKELEDFMFWVASNRAETLSSQDRENLFTQDDIDAGKSLADGDLEFDYLLANGATTRDRRDAYEDALKKFNEFNKNVLDIAEQSGLIDGDSRQFWEGEFYVPFYRVSEEDGEFVGAKIKGGLARQRAFHELKGGSQKLNSDLLANTMRNWAHLIDASAKNRAAKATLESAQSVGIAIESDAETVRQLGKSMGGKGGTVWFMDGGQQRHFLVDDPYLLEAINSLEYAGLRGPLMDALSTMKHWLTVGVTASPAFKVRNLIRDSIQAISLSGLSYNPVKNLVEGYKATDRESQDYVSALASGGLIRFGTMLEGNAAERVRRLVQKGVPASTILNTPGKVKDFYGKFVEPAVEAYQELGNRGEEINRASLYKQLRAQGINHAEASLMARDLMDFSMQGTWTSIRFLTQVVPFLNARLQGLYKLGRGAAEDPKRFAMVAGATAMVSVALLAAYGDDDDWKKREDWDRDGFWWFKFGGAAFRIPKPFEVGAIATLAERGVELFTNDEFTAKRFGSRVMHLLGDNLAMNPIPQAVKPMLDIYANKDSFSGRPIESMGMERLQAEYRYNVNTSMIARGASSALNAATRTVGADSLSPVQIDSLIRGYFGWLGTFVVAGADMAVRPLTNEPTRPQTDYIKVVTQGFLKTLPEPGSKYVSAMYDQAKIMEQAYATHRQLLKEGKLDDAREFSAENKDLLERHRLIEAVKKTQSNINRRIREIEISDMDPARKRDEIQKLRDQADRSARAVY